MTTRCRGRHLKTNGIRLHYLDYTGEKPPLILVPGITSPAATWGFVGERLSALANVCILDNRGRGLSEGGPHLDYTLDTYAADLAGLIDGLTLDRPAVLGHSMGAWIAIRLATRFPNRVGRLILADPPMSGPGRAPYPFPLEFYLAAIEEASRGRGGVARAMNPSWSEEQIELRMQWLPTCDGKAVTDSYRSFHEEDIWRELGAIRTPTTLIYAPDGKVVSEADAADFAARLPACRRIAIPKAGHMIPWDDLDGFVAAVAQALDGAT